MRRILAVLVATSVIAPTTMQAVSAGEPTISFGGRALHRDWVAWGAGSDTNPLVDPTFCGEMVDGQFYLNLAGELEATYDCQIAAGTTIVASAGYGIVWKPTEAKSDRGLRQALDELLEGFGPPKGKLDGEAVDLDPAFAKTGVYSIAVGADSLIQTVDPDFPEDRTRTKVAAGAWVFKISGLLAGDHRLIVRQRIFGNWARAVFNIAVA